jgi:hypothetical protein
VCYGEGPSFTAGILLCGTGLTTVRLAQRPAELPLAAIPLLFGIQQLSEGVVWRSLDRSAGSTSIPAVSVYLAFALVLWPCLIPLAAWLVEPDAARRRVMLGAGVLGVVVSGSLAWLVLRHDVIAVAEARRIVYEQPDVPDLLVPGYIVAATLPLLVASVRTLNVFGVLAILTAAASYVAYSQAFVSVWCFQAAIMALVVLAHFTRAARVRPATG